MQSLGLTLAMTLTLDFQGQIFEQTYLRNRRAKWQKGVIHDHDLLVTKMRCKDLPDSDQHAIISSSY